jgi:hypothetical protein
MQTAAASHFRHTGQPASTGARERCRFQLIRRLAVDDFSSESTI